MRLTHSTTHPTANTHHCSAALLIAAAAGSMMLLCDDAAAQQRRYKVTPIMKIDFIPGEAHGTAGINNAGQVVYAYSTGGQPGPYRPFIWLALAAWGFPAGNSDLPLCNTGTGIARDINNNGLAAGQVGGVGTLGGNAAVWSLNGMATVCTPLPTFTPANLPYSSAFALNDDQFPVVVGQSALLLTCGCFSTNPADNVRGFRFIFGQSAALEMLTPGNDVGSFARDIMPLGTIIAGFTDCIDQGPGGSEATCDTPPTCEWGKDPARWIVPNVVNLMARLQPDGPGLEVHGVNNNSEFVGWGKVQGPGVGECSERATFWNSAGQVTNLGSLLTQRSTAAAINNLTPPQVVGTNVQANTGQLWERPGGTWQVLDLDSDAGVGHATTSIWDVRQAQDINNNGWIVAHGFFNPTQHPILGQGNYLILLIPITGCEADVTADGCINMDDLLGVINAWGTQCQIGQLCAIPADINSDLIVNIDDLNAVVNAWCPGSCGGPCCVNCPPCFEDGPMSAPASAGAGGNGGPPTVEMLIELVLQSSQPPEVQAQIIYQLLQQ